MEKTKAKLNIQKPTEASFDGLYKLINYFAEKREMLPKSYDELYKYRRAFRILVNENRPLFCSDTGGDAVLGSAMLDLFTPVLAEIKSLAVHPGAQGKGYGRLLVEDCEQEAKELGIKKLFVLTYQVDFFKKLGYKVVSMDALPEKVFKECSSCPFKDDCNETAMIKEFQ